MMPFDYRLQQGFLQTLFFYKDEIKDLRLTLAISFCTVILKLTSFFLFHLLLN